jgi:hypothetical protein
MARIRIEQLERGEEELSGAQAAGVMGAGYYWSPPPFMPSGASMMSNYYGGYGGYNSLSPYTGMLSPAGYVPPVVPNVVVYPWW